MFSFNYSRQKGYQHFVNFLVCLTITAINGGIDIKGFKKNPKV